MVDNPSKSTHWSVEPLLNETITDIGLYKYVRAVIQQNVVADSDNSSDTNLDVGNSYTFTGTAVSTLGVAGIQTSLYADKNCTIYVEQSPDGTNWDLIDTYYYTASTNFGVTTQAISSYHRVVVTTAMETTTVFRLQTALCPIVEAVPRSLDGNGNFKISSPTDNYDFKAENTPMGDQRVAEIVRLVGSSFEGSTIDARFWIAAATGGAGGSSVAQGNAQMTLTSGTANADTVTAYTLRRSRYVSGVGMRYRAVVQVSAGLADNKRRWGIGYGAAMPTVTDGAWFQLDGTEFAVVTCKGTTQTKVTTFNGQLGATFDPGTSVRTYEIYWTNSKVWFVVNDQILHTVSASAATWSSTMGFHVFMDSVNAGVIASSRTLEVRVASIARLGKLESQPTYYRISGDAATHVLKLGAGVLHKLIFNNTTGTSITIYDNTSAAAPIIGVITTASGAIGEWDYGVHFNTGLTLVTVGNGLDMTCVYE